MPEEQEVAELWQYVSNGLISRLLIEAQLMGRDKQESTDWVVCHVSTQRLRIALIEAAAAVIEELETELRNLRVERYVDARLQEMEKHEEN